MIPSLIVLASGELGYSSIMSIPKSSIKHLFTDKKSEKLISFAEKSNIPYTTTNPRKIGDFNFIKGILNSWILSINYLYVLPPEMIEVVQGKALNIHGSLLPKYRGRTPHVWAIINGEKECGITLHFIAPDVDAGDIVSQVRIPIAEDDTGGSLLQKYERKYPELIKNVLEGIERESLPRIPQNNNEATFFSKRMPENGLLAWSWQKERILNWVRALTKPYPGAFNFVNGKKITLWACRESGAGFNYETPNGLVVSKNAKSFFVKCPNAVIEVFEYDYDGEIEPGEILE
jgi:methionyl-tRNA formyltransferase